MDADTDLSSRIAELASQIEKELSEDEGWAKVALEIDGTGKWQPSHRFTVIDSTQVRIQATDGATAIHAARQDPARTLRRVKATRDLVAAVLAEKHNYVPGDEYYSCSQAREDDGAISGPTGPPGSGCSDPERTGQPCDCGRDQRVARLLGIIASEWDGEA